MLVKPTMDMYRLGSMNDQHVCSKQGRSTKWLVGLLHVADIGSASLLDNANCDDDTKGKA